MMFTGVYLFLVSQKPEAKCDVTVKYSVSQRGAKAYHQQRELAFLGFAKLTKLLCV